MKTRRTFIKAALGIAAGIGILSSPLFFAVKSVYAKAKKVILPKGTRMEQLVNENPADLDTRNLNVIQMKDFGTMGLSDHKMDLDKWALVIEGNVEKPLSLSYEELLRLPTIKRKVLLICPGFFANYGEWGGISINEFLKLSEASKGITHITVKGPCGQYEKTERFSVDEVASDKVFLANKVNGETLPVKHGFPLRVVAEGHYGDEWVKYVCRITVEKIEE